MGQSDRKLLHDLLFYIFHGLKIIRQLLSHFQKHWGVNKHTTLKEHLLLEISSILQTPEQR